MQDESAYLLYNRDISEKKEVSMSFKENSCQKISFSDSFTGLTVREQKVLENSWEKVFADEIFPDIDEKRFSVLYSDKASRPNTPVNVIVGALFLIILMMRCLKILCWIFGSSMRCIQQVLRNSL